MNKKGIQKTAIALFFFVLSIYSIYFVSFVSAPETVWWNSSWNYKIPINVSTQDNLKDYQILLNITYDSDMASDFSDLRFLNSSENQELPYWIENYTSGVNATVWVKGNWSNANGTQMYMYYGNTTPVSTTSNGNNTFIFFDDFNGANVLDTSKWSKSIYGTFGIDLGIVGGMLNMTSTGGAGTNYIFYKTKDAIGLNRSVETKFRISGTDIYSKITLTNSTSDYDSGGLGFQQYYPQNGGININGNGEDRTFHVGVGNYWLIDRMIRNESVGVSVSILNPNSRKVLNVSNISGGGTITSLNVTLQNSGSGATTAYWDWIFVRNWTQYEPTYTLGAEETSNSPPQWSNNQSSIGALNQISFFNVTWADDIDANAYNFSFFELGFPNGTSTNYTAWRFPNNINHYNLSIVSRGYHNFSFYANDSSNSWNKTAVWKFLTNANETTTNNATQASWNETFAGNQNNTFWVNIPKYAQVIDAKLNLSGYYNTIENTSINYSFSQIITNNAGGIYNNSPYSLAFDDDYGTSYFFGAYNNLNSNWYIEANLTIYNIPSSINKLNYTRSYYDGSSGSGTIEYNESLLNYTSDVFVQIEGIRRTVIADLNTVNNTFLTISQDFINNNNLTFKMWISLSGGPNAGRRYIYEFDLLYDSNSSNPYLDVAQNGNKDWQFGGEFTQLNNRTANFSSEIQSYLSTCTAKADGTCDVPFILHSDTAGKIQNSDISILWYMGNRPPNWLANSTSKTSPQTYNPSNNYGFQINWTDIDNNFANTTFQLGRPNGLYTNYTNASTIKTQYVSGANYTGNAIWYINFTQNQIGGTGTYNYTWFGIDEEGTQNKSDTINYIINKQPISLSLFPATQTITYENTITQYCSDNSTEYDCTLWKNDTNITVKNNTVEVYGFGVHFFKTNVSALLENYTWTEQNSTITINQKNINIYLALNGTQANRNYDYPDVLNATVWKDTTFNNEGTITLLENGTSKSNPRIWQPAVATYNYSVYMTATNYSATSIQDRMTIYAKAPTLARLFLNNSEASRNYEQGRTANFTATLNVSGKTVYITSNMTGWVLQSGATLFTNTTKLSDVFVYNITGYFAEDENYTSSQQSYFATVVAPIAVNNPTPTSWYYDNQQKTDNFFTNLWNITNNSVNIANITFILENRSSGSLQTYYANFLANEVAFNSTNCNRTIIAGSSCNIFARYKNILSGSQTLNLTYNISYTDGEKIQNTISTSVSMTNETTTQNTSYINITLIKINSTSASINSLNLKGITSTQALWLNTTHYLDYEIGNPTSQTLTNVNITLNIPYGYTTNKSQAISSLASGAKRNITFQVNTTDVSTFRGWGLDTFWIIANSTQNVDGANYNMFRLLVQKNITINMDIPGLKELGNTTAGTPITITVNFTNNGDYSIFYPHIFLNLNGTFGFEAGHITSKTSTDPTDTVCRTDLNKTVNPKTSLINASRTLYSIYGWKGAAADTIRTVDLKPSIGILTPDWNESVSYDVNVNNIIIGSGVGSSIDSFIPTITASSLADALSSIVLNQNNNMTFRVTPNSAAPSGRYNISYPVCYEGGISSTNDIFSPPIAMKIFIQKDTSDAFRVPGYEDLVRTSTENLAPGESSSTYSFSIIPPSVSETYTISAIVFDDTETGQWFEEAKQINALNTYPDKNIAVKDYDYNTSELVANAVENSLRFNMTRRMTVENRNLNNYSMIEWRTVFPGDASNISGTLSGIVESLCGNCITYPSNISFTLPGISTWASQISYGSSYTEVGSNITGTITITQYNNATTQTWYDVKVNATSHVPANYSATSDLVWFISSLRPERQTTNSISITSSAPAETNWTIAKNSTDYYIYNATIEVPNNNTKNREIRYVFDRSRLTDYSSDNIFYTIDGNSTNLSYSISSSQFTLTIPTTFNNGQSLDYGNHTVIISYLMASTTVSVGGGGTLYAPAQCNIGYQLIGNICQPTELGFTIKPDPIVVNISFAEWFSQQKQIEIINTVNRDINLSVETASADGSDKWVSFSAGFQNLKKVELITLNPKSSFSGGSAFLTYSINIPQNASGTYETDIILKNLANGRSATVRMVINITEGKASVFNILAVIGVVTAALMAAAYLLNRRRKRKKQ